MARHIFRNSKGSVTSAALNVMGMALAFAALYLILVQIRYDLGYNKNFKDSERIYVITVPDWYEEGRYMTHLGRPIWEDMIENLPCVECGGCSFMLHRTFAEFYTDESGTDKILFEYTKASSGLMNTFGIEMSEGSIENLKTNTDIIIKESKARELGIGVGSVLYDRYNEQPVSLSVVAVFRDMPENCDLSSIDIIMNIGDRDLGNFGEWSYNYFIKLHSAEEKETFEKQAFQRIIDLYSGKAEDEDLSEESLEEFRQRWECRLFSVEDLYFSKLVNTPGRSGNRTTTLTLLAIALLVTAIAFINFINFFFALVPVKLRSVNTRKILGASRASLVAGIVAESVAMIAAGLVLAGILVKIFTGSHLASLISCNTALSANITTVIITVAAALVLSILSSLYPALYLTSFSPAFALKGSFGSVSKGKAFRYALICFQFVTSTTLIICAAFISMQRSYMMHYDMGFDKQQLLTVNTSRKVADMRRSCTDRLMENPLIVDVTWANGDIVAPGRMGWGREFKGEQINYECYPVAWNFLKFMGIEIAEGRDFTETDEMSETGVYIFNEAARDKFSMTLEDKLYGHNGFTEIAGFCKNFNFKSLESEIQPLALYIFGKFNPYKILNTLYIRTAENADIESVFHNIKTVLSEMDPSVGYDEIEVSFFDEKLDSQYEKEKKTSTIVTLFTILAIAISLMGVFGLVMFDAEYRRKEIGVRRVNGAEIKDIILMFNIKFVKIVLICFVIAAPLSYAVTGFYLKSFAYRMPVQWWVYAAALAAVLAITAAVVTAKSFSAAVADPVKSLKSE